MNIPLARWVRTYRREWLRPDIIAGITVAVVIIPKTMAFAAVAGLPVEVGLYTALAATLAYPLFGTSRPLSVTTASALAMMTAAAIATVAARHPEVEPRAVASTLALMVGGVLLVASILRLGFLANFISEPVLIGFQAAVGVVIITSQISPLLGAHGKSNNPIGVMLELPRLIMDTHALTLAISVGCIAVLVLLPRLMPKVPAPLVLMVASVAASSAFHLGSAGVKLVGKVPETLPPLTMPDFSYAVLIWPTAVGIALMSFVETMATARSFCRRDDPRVSANQELLALAAANAASGFAGGMAAGGVPSPTAISDNAGARSQLAQWISGGIVLVTLVSLARYIALVPKPALAAVIVASAAPLIKPRAFRAIARVRRLELMWAVVTLVGSVLFGFLEGVVIAVIISVLTLIHQATRPPVYALLFDREKGVFRPAAEAEDCEAFPGLLLLRVEGRLMFANAANVAEKLQALVARTNARIIVLECSAILDIEYTAMDLLTEAAHNLHRRGVELWLAGVNESVMRVIERSPLLDAVGPEHIFHDLSKVHAAWQVIAGRDEDTTAPAVPATPAFV